MATKSWLPKVKVAGKKKIYPFPIPPSDTSGKYRDKTLLNTSLKYLIKLTKHSLQRLPRLPQPPRHPQQNHLPHPRSRPK